MKRVISKCKYLGSVGHVLQLADKPGRQREERESIMQIVSVMNDRITASR